MGRDRARRAIILTLLAASTALGDPAWGPPSNGLALGIDTGRTYGGEKRLRVHFRNSGPTAVDLAVGATSGGLSTYTVDITAIAPNGTSCKLLDLTIGSVGGYVGPINKRLGPGETDYVSIDLRKLICMRGRVSVTLDTLLRRGHAVHASFTAKPENNAWAKIPNGWTGTVTSETRTRSR